MRSRHYDPIIAAVALALAVSTQAAEATTIFRSIDSPSGAPDGKLVPTGFSADDILLSPSGVFNGVLQGDGNFVVFYGPDPNSKVLWSTGRSRPGGPYSIYYGRVLGPNSTSAIIYDVFQNPGGEYYRLFDPYPAPNGPTFLRLNDNGTLSLYPGTKGVAAGPAVATIGNPATLQNLALSSIQYDLPEAKFPDVEKQYGATHILRNPTPTTATQTAELSLTYADTQTYDWNTTESVGLKIGATKSFKVPLIGATEFSLELSGSTSFSQGKSTSSGTEVTYRSQVSVPVPPFSTYSIRMFAFRQEALVPYVYTGVYNFTDGTSVMGGGAGEFDGVSTGVFETLVTCISGPDCSKTPAFVIPAPPETP
jgi:hypothetical protein